MSLPAFSKRLPFHYGWIAAGVTFLTLLAAAGARAAPSVMIVPLGNDFQWSRAKVSAIISFNIFLFGLVGPFAAALYESVGLRRTMMLAMACIGGGYVASTYATQYWQFFFCWGLIVGLGSGTAATVLGAAVANRWFDRHRGLVMGILTASSATGQLVFLPQLAQVVTAHGWRAAPKVVAWACVLTLPIIAWLMRDGPEVAANADGAPAAPPLRRVNPARLALTTLGDAVKVRDFWLLAGSFFVCGASTNGLIGTHLVSAAYDCGIPEVRAASLVALMGIFDLFGTTMSGWLSDRWNSRYLLFGYYGLRGLSLLFLPYALVGSSTMLLAFSVFYGLDWIATVPPTVRLTAEVFGRERASIVFGWVVAAHQVGAAFAAFAAGWLRTTSGTYMLAFTGAGALCLGAALAVLPISRAKAGGADLAGMPAH